MRFEEFEKAKLTDLKSEAKSRFSVYEDPNTGGMDKAALLLETQFYMNEMDRRHDNSIARRDLILELIVIGLIGMEIVLGWCQGKVIDKQTKILQNVSASSSATVKALQDQLDLFYEPSVAGSFVPTTKEFNLLNNGRANIELWGSKLAAGKPILFNRAEVLPLNAGYKFGAGSLYNELSQLVKRGSQMNLPYDIYLKNERGKEYIAHFQLAVFWQQDTLTIFTQLNGIEPAKWSQ
jgi:hypothetical protein